MAIESASAQLLMSHSTNSGVALCLKPSNWRLKLSAASLKNQLRETHISTVFEVEFRRPKRAVIIFKIMTARPVLRNSTSMVVKIGASALAKTKSHGELERAVAKFQRPTGSQILSAKLKSRGCEGALRALDQAPCCSQGVSAPRHLIFLRRAPTPELVIAIAEWFHGVLWKFLL